MTQHKFHKGQKVYLTGGPNGTRKIPGEVVDGPDEDGDFIVRIDGPHGFYDEDTHRRWRSGNTWFFDSKGYSSFRSHIIPQEPDFTAQWDQVQAFAAQRGVTVPDLPEPEDDDLKMARQIVKQYYPEMKDGYTGRRVQIVIAAIKKVRAEFEGEG